MKDNIEFKNIEELYSRVKPALYSKLKEIKGAGYDIVCERDIWEYLVINVWKKRSDITLSDLINDIFYANNYSVYEYVVNKLKRIKSKSEIIDENIL